MLKTVVLILSLIFSSLALSGPGLASMHSHDDDEVAVEFEAPTLSQDVGHEHPNTQHCDCRCPLEHLHAHSLNADLQNSEIAVQAWLFDQIANFESTQFKEGPYLESPWQPPRNA